MDGYTLLFLLRESMNEASGSDWINDQLSYTYLYDAAKELNARTAAITSSQSITTVATQQEYNLNPDFLSLYLTDNEGSLIIKVNDGTDDTFITFKPYAQTVYDNLTDSVEIPDGFTIKHATTAVVNVTGTASADGTLSNGEATLTDTTSATKFSTISVGDMVHNTTDGTHGIVIAKTSDTALVTAMFDGAGTAAGWTIADAYVIVPQGRFALLLDPPPSTAGYTVTVAYIQKPTPVFSPYRSYKFPTDCSRELVDYAVGRYKFRDRDPSTGATWLSMADRALNLSGGTVKKATNRNTFHMNLKGRRR
jgi:hypothetical protein